MVGGEAKYSPDTLNRYGEMKIGLHLASGSGTMSNKHLQVGSGENLISVRNENYLSLHATEEMPSMIRPESTTWSLFYGKLRECWSRELEVESGPEVRGGAGVRCMG